MKAVVIAAGGFKDYTQRQMTPLARSRAWRQTPLTIHRVGDTFV